MNYPIVVSIIVILILGYVYYKKTTQLNSDLATCNKSSGDCIDQVNSLNTSNGALKQSLLEGGQQIQNLQSQLEQLASSSLSQTEKGKQALVALQAELRDIQLQLSQCQVGSSAEASQIKDLQFSVANYQRDLARLQQTCITSCPACVEKVCPNPKQFLFAHSDIGSFYVVFNGDQMLLYSPDNDGPGDRTFARWNRVSGSNTFIGKWENSNATSDTLSIMLDPASSNFVLTSQIGTVMPGFPSLVYPIVPSEDGKSLVTLVDGMFITEPSMSTYILQDGKKRTMHSWNGTEYYNSITPVHHVSYFISSLIPTGEDLN